MELKGYLSYAEIDEHLATLVHEIGQCSIEICEKIERAALDNSQGVVDCSSVNSSGDEQKKLDVISNDIMTKAIIDTGHCSLLVSEEDDDEVIVQEPNAETYMVAFDPLDGSSNIDCNCCVGTIFSIYEDKDPTKSLKNRICRSGNEVICAGYVLYGPATEMVLTFTGKGVRKFTLDRKKGGFVDTGILDIREKKKKIYCINEGNSLVWFDDIKKYIQQYRDPLQKYTQRYIGSMVADVHRTLLYGGMFCYPADKKNTHGKLRVLYECFPMAKILEEAGGKAIVGKMSKQRILDIVPTEIHQRTPILLGSSVEIVKYEKTLESFSNDSMNTTSFGLRKFFDGGWIFA
jgi:fructose-1,6-bisphosphatase I